jgi:hypothetical protein
MRCLILTSLLLTLPGCTYENPLFGVSGETPSSSGADTATSVALTDEPVTTTAEPTAATSVTTGDEPGTTTLPEPGTTTLPGTTQTSDPVDSSSTGIEPEPPLCPATNDAFAPYLLLDFLPLAQCPPGDIVYIFGKLAVGDPLLLSSSIDCGGKDVLYQLGTGMQLPPHEMSDKCLKTALKLVTTEKGCKINQIKTYDPDNGVVYLAAAFSAPPDGLPFNPKAINSEYCGCADPNNEGPNCCADLDPGELVLQPTNDDQIQLLQFHFATVPDGDDQLFDFYNLQSWVGPECVNNSEAGRHIDWIAVRL